MEKRLSTLYLTEIELKYQLLLALQVIKVAV